jgi:hypothetical protein
MKIQRSGLLATKQTLVLTNTDGSYKLLVEVARPHRQYLSGQVDLGHDDVRQHVKGNCLRWSYSYTRLSVVERSNYKHNAA